MTPKKHVLLYVLAAVCVIFAGVVVWSNRTALTVPHLLFSGVLVVLAVFLAGGADAAEAAKGVGEFARQLKGAKDAGSC